MAQPKDDAPESLRYPNRPWNDRVRFTRRGTAYRPNELLVRSTPEDRIGEFANRLRPFLRDREGGITRVGVGEGTWLLRSSELIDVEYAVAELRDAGATVELNHVLFVHNTAGGAHGLAPCNCGFQAGQPALGANPFYSNAVSAAGVGANPFYSNAVGANPFYSNPFYSNPFYSNPFYSNPFYSNPFYSNPFYSNDLIESGLRPSSALPAQERALHTSTLAPAVAKAFILDTGIATGDLPKLIDLPNHQGAAADDHESADENTDGYLDPASGHGTFIAGILERIAPGQDVHVASVLTSFGDGDVAGVAAKLDELRTTNQINDRTVINMSFGSYADDDMPSLAQAVRRVQNAGAVVVASAGNDGTCRPSFPACLPGVISVGSIEPYGPAPYSNHGPWVRACAPGTAVISSFFNSFNGDIPPITAPGEPDPDQFNGWAQWTGTSFAAPIVAAVLMRHIALTKGTAAEAVEHIIDAPGLLRMPNLGTVINVAPVCDDIIESSP